MFDASQKVLAISKKAGGGHGCPRKQQQGRHRAPGNNDAPI
jgi:hypothetical protein